MEKEPNIEPRDRVVALRQAEQRDLVVATLSIHSVDKNHQMPLWRRSLAFGYLQAFATNSAAYSRCSFVDMNYDTNDDPQDIVEKIVESKPHVLAVSCYIWNIEILWRLLLKIRCEMTDLVTIAGGPEFSRDNAEDILKGNEALDFVVIGEGEQSFKEFLDYLAGEGELSLGAIDGLVFR